MKRMWLVPLAVVVFVALLALAEWRGNALIFVAGGLVAGAITTPLWRERPRILLLALLFYLPLEDALVASFAHNVTAARVLPDALLFGAFGLRLVLAWRRGERVLGTALDLPVASLLVVAIISMLLNHIPPTQAAQGPYTLFRYAALFYLTASSRFEDREVRVLVRGLVWLGILECGLVFVQFLLVAPNGSLPSGTMASANTMGLYLALVCTIAVAFYARPQIGLPPRELWLLLGCSFTAILVALSRQSALALVLGIAVVCAFLVRREIATVEPHKKQWSNVLRRNWRSLIALWPAGVSSLAGIGLGSVAVKLGWAGRVRPAVEAAAGWLAARGAPGLLALFKAGDTAGSASAYHQQIVYKTTQTGSSQLFSTNFYYNPRLYTIVNAAPAILRKSPLFGLGPGTFGAQATYHNHTFYDSLNVGLLLRSPNSTFVADVEWITVLGQLGLLGIAGMLWLLFAIGQTGARIWSRSQQPIAQALGSVCVALVPVFLLVGFLGPNFEIRPISSLLWFVPGLALSLWRTEEKNLSREPASAATPDRAPLISATAARASADPEAPENNE